MVIDKFGRSSSHKFNNSPHNKPRFFGFSLTPSGDFDFQKKRICNISKPTELNDATTKLYVDENLKQIVTLKNEFRVSIHSIRKELNDLKAKILDKTSVNLVLSNKPNSTNKTMNIS